MADITWTIDGKPAAAREVQARLAAARSERHTRSVETRRRRAHDREIEANARRVATSIRKAIREDERSMRSWIFARAPKGQGTRTTATRCVRFEAATGHGLPRPSRTGRDGRSSFHFRWTSRGLGERRQNRGNRYRRGEAVRQLVYILRPEALEDGPDAVHSNISADRDQLAGFFAALEALEMQDRSNANVYVTLVVSLPHELTTAQRGDAVAAIGAILASHDLPYVAALHAPDPEGDQRNFHAHILTSLRPVRVLADGEYAFAAGKSSSLNDPSFITDLRAETAEILNSAMERAGHARRFTPLSNADRGMSAPAPGASKLSPGQVRVARREADLVQMRAERDEIAARQAVLRRLREQMNSLATWSEPDLVARRAEIRRRMAEQLRRWSEQIVGEASAVATRLEALRARMAETRRRHIEEEDERARRQRQAEVARKAAVARTQPATASPPIPAADPARIEAITRVVAMLDARRFPPLRRIKGIVRLTDWDGTYPPVHDMSLRDADRLSDDPAVQLAIDRCWQWMIDEARRIFDDVGGRAINLYENGNRFDNGHISRGLQSALLHAREDTEVNTLIENFVDAARKLQAQQREAQQKRDEEKQLHLKRRKQATGDLVARFDAEMKDIGAIIAHEPSRDYLRFCARAVIDGKLRVVEVDGIVEVETRILSDKEEAISDGARDIALKSLSSGPDAFMIMSAFSRAARVEQDKHRGGGFEVVQRISKPPVGGQTPPTEVVPWDRGGRDGR